MKIYKLETNYMQANIGKLNRAANSYAFNFKPDVNGFDLDVYNYADMNDFRTCSDDAPVDSFEWKYFPTKAAAEMYINAHMGDVVGCDEAHSNPGFLDWWESTLFCLTLDDKKLLPALNDEEIDPSNLNAVVGFLSVADVDDYTIQEDFVCEFDFKFVNGEKTSNIFVLGTPAEKWYIRDYACNDFDTFQEFCDYFKDELYDSPLFFKEAYNYTDEEKITLDDVKKMFD